MKPSIQKLLSNYEHLNFLPKFERDGKPMLTGIEDSKVGEYVILMVRDPLCGYEDDPAAQVAARLENSQLVARTGMFLSYSGYFDGAHISVVSGGSGAPEAELVLMEYMIYTHAHTFIRVGGSGAWSENVHPGDIVISSGAVRDEGMTRSYIAPQFPAIASYEVLVALVQAAARRNSKIHVGITRSGDSEYCGWGKPGVNGYIQPVHTEIIDYYNRAGVLNADRETSAVLTLTTLFGRRGGSICSIGDSVVAREAFKAGGGQAEAIEITLNALGILKRMDDAKKACGTTYWFPA